MVWEPIVMKLENCIWDLQAENDRLRALLKEHEPVEPKQLVDGLVTRYACGNCGKHLVIISNSWRDNYCSKCGRKVEWND